MTKKSKKWIPIDDLRPEWWGMDLAAADHARATCDERHTHTGRALWDALNQAKGARRQTLQIRLDGPGVAPQ